MQAFWNIAKLALVGLSLLPLASLVLEILHGPLAANPYPTFIRETGLWSIRLLVATLALSPAAALSGTATPLRFRRLLGLMAALYAAVHLLAWAKDYGFLWGFLAGEIAARAYLLIGFVAALLLVPLAATSTDGSLRRLRRWWRRLHWLVYPAAGLAWIHFALAGRVRATELWVEAIALAAVLCWRAAGRPRVRASG